MLTREMFEEARERLQPVLRKTRLINSPHFSKLNQLQIYLKPENLQLTGAYKIRGAYYAVSQLSD